MRFFARRLLVGFSVSDKFLKVQAVLQIFRYSATMSYEQKNDVQAQNGTHSVGIIRKNLQNALLDEISEMEPRGAIFSSAPTRGIFGIGQVFESSARAPNFPLLGNRIL